MNNLQRFTAALDARLGQLRIDVLNDFAASTREEEKSFFDGVSSAIPYPIAGIASRSFDGAGTDWMKKDEALVMDNIAAEFDHVGIRVLVLRPIGDEADEADVFRGIANGRVDAV